MTDMYTRRTQFLERIDRIRAIDTSSVLAETARHRATIKEVKEGGVIRFRGNSYLVQDLSSYLETDADHKPLKSGDQWYELRLINLATGETLWLEWEEDDDIVIFETTSTLKFSNLRDEDGVGIDDDDLDQIVNDEDSVYLNGVEFEYDDDYGARYTRGRGGGKETKGEKVYFYDFVSSNGDCITIEEWGSKKDGYDYEIFVSRQLSSRDLLVVGLGSGA